VEGGTVNKILTVEQADALAARTREAIAQAARDWDPEREDIHDTDLRALDAWLLVLHHAHDGLRECLDCPCGCGLPDHRGHQRHARRYTDLAQTASDTLTSLARLYGVEETA
jgi:hypothetical protein